MSNTLLELKSVNIDLTGSEIQLSSVLPAGTRPKQFYFRGAKNNSNPAFVGTEGAATAALATLEMAAGETKQLLPFEFASGHTEIDPEKIYVNGTNAEDLVVSWFE